MNLHSKRLFSTYTALAFLLGCILMYVVSSPKTNIPFNPLSANTPSINNPDSAYNIRRVKGFVYIRPILSASQSTESVAFLPLKKQLNSLIDSLQHTGDISQASVYIQKYNAGQWMSINEKTRYHPASLMKVPLLISYLKMAEANPGLLQTKWRYTKPDSVVISTQYYSAPQIELGKEYSVHELLYYMIAYSDNHATWLLASHFDFNQTKKIFADFGLDAPVTDELGFTLNTREYSLFMKSIFNSSYLSPDYSEYAASLLGNCTYAEGLKKAFPPNTKMWHKFGEWRVKGQEYELHESSFVYINDTPYLITIMTKGHHTDKQAASICLLGKAIFEKISEP